MDKQKLTLASSYAAMITIVFVVVITIWAELSAPLKDWLKNFSGHHWTTKSIFSVALYGLSTFIFYKGIQSIKGEHLRRALEILILVVGFGVLCIALFYTGHHLKLF